MRIFSTEKSAKKNKVLKKSVCCRFLEYGMQIKKWFKVLYLVHNYVGYFHVIQLNDRIIPKKTTVK